MFAGNADGNRQFDYRQRFRYSRVARGRRNFGRKKIGTSRAKSGGTSFYGTVPETSHPAPLPAPPNETAFRARNHNELDSEGFLDFHLHDRRQDATPQEPEINPAPPTAPEKKRSGPLGRFLDDKSQEDFDAVNSLIEERLQEIKTAIEANARTLVAQVFWLTVAAGLTASLLLHYSLSKRRPRLLS